MISGCATRWREAWESTSLQGCRSHLNKGIGCSARADVAGQSACISGHLVIQRGADLCARVVVVVDILGWGGWVGGERVGAGVHVCELESWDGVEALQNGG